MKPAVGSQRGRPGPGGRVGAASCIELRMMAGGARPLALHGAVVARRRRVLLALRAVLDDLLALLTVDGRRVGGRAPRGTARTARGAGRAGARGATGLVRG